MSFKFYKFQGTGNDFIIIDQIASTIPIHLTKKNIEKLCDRRFGIGADGLILLNKHPSDDFQMIYFNSDGEESSMCGNGGRCVVKLAHELGYIQDKCTFIAIDGRHHAEVEGELVRLKMSDVLDYQKMEFGYYLNTGSPHLVQQVDDIEDLDVLENGRFYRYHEYFKPGGTNVNFIQFKKNTLSIRTYERGVENETLSCGTGTVAGAIVAELIRPSDEKYIKMEVLTLGGKLSVEFDKKGQNQIENIWLTGPAKMVFTGEIMP